MINLSFKNQNQKLIKIAISFTKSFSNKMIFEKS